MSPCVNNTTGVSAAPGSVINNNCCVCVGGGGRRLRYAGDLLWHFHYGEAHVSAKINTGWPNLMSHRGMKGTRIHAACAARTCLRAP